VVSSSAAKGSGKAKAAKAAAKSAAKASAAVGTQAADVDSGTDADVDTGTGTGTDTDTDTDSKDAAPAAASVPDPARAAQLRRQQAARSAARARRSRDANPARGALRRSVLAEAAIAAVLLAVTTMLSGSQPGRAAEEQKGLADAPPASSSSTAPGTSSAPTSAPGTGAPAQIALDVPYDTGGPKGKGTAGVTLSPAAASAPNEIHLLLTDPAGSLVDVPEVRVSFTLPAQHLGPIPVTLHRIDTGHWTASGVRLPLAGTWQMSLTVRTSDIDEATEIRNVKVTS
jgi:copper transport protein